MRHLRTPSLAWAFGLVTLGLAWSACSSDEAEGEAPVFRYRASTEFCTAVAQAACSDNVIRGCGRDPANVADRTQCTTAVRGRCTAGDFDASRRLNVTGAAYQGAQAEDCIRAVEAAHADATLTAADIADINARCDIVFSRRSPEGGSCQVKADCANGGGAPELDCFFDAQGAGVCTTLKLVAAGEACTELGSVCADDGRDLFCNGQNCIVNTAGVAEPCSPGNRCGDAERCLADAGAMPGSPVAFSCQPKLGDDQPCAANEECTSGICALRFDPQRNVVRLCTRTVQLNNIEAAVCGPYLQ